MLNKNEFKNEIENFLAEIEARKQEVANNKLTNTIQIGKNLFDYARKNFNDSYQLVYSVHSIRLDVIFHLGEKAQLHNASNFTDITHLYNALKYQILANKKLYENITLDEFYFVYWGFLTRLMRNFNWGQTINVNNNAYYLPWMNNKGQNILSDAAISCTYKAIFIDNDNTVKDINGDTKEINIKNSDYNTMKKLSKEELITLINSFDEMPTVKQIADKHNSESDTFIRKELMRRYIQDYELEDMIKINKYKK